MSGVRCPLCYLDYEPKDADIRLPTGDNSFFNCPRCGEFTISGTMEAICFRTPPDDRRKGFSYAARERTAKGLPTKILTDTQPGDLFTEPQPMNPAEKARRLLYHLARMTENPGDEVNLIPSFDYVLAHASGPKELVYYLDWLKADGLLEIVTRTLNHLQVKLSASALAEDVKEQNASSELGPPNGAVRVQAQGEQMAAPSQNPIDKRKVFLVHGRDRQAHEAMLAFLRSLDLDPWDFDRAHSAMPHGAPHIDDVLKWAFEHAWCVLVLITGDDEARLRQVYWGKDEKEGERTLMAQPRPNVLFEAGRALALHEERTILVQIGESKPFSDVAGRFVHRLTGVPAERKKLKEKLQSIGCAVQETGNWLEAGDFGDVMSHRGAHSPDGGAGPLMPSIGQSWNRLLTGLKMTRNRALR